MVVVEIPLESLKFRLSRGASGWIMQNLAGLYIGNSEEHLLIVGSLTQLQQFADQLHEFLQDPTKLDPRLECKVSDESWKTPAIQPDN